MRTMDTVMAPLRASRAALAPYVENLQDRYAYVDKYARAKAQDLVRRQPKAMRLLTNRYVLISLAAGACVFAMRRLQHWRQLRQSAAAPKRQQNGARHAAASARKNGRAARTARVH